MRLYTENWDYTLAPDSSPYGINNGNPYTDNNTLVCPAAMYVSKGYLGTPYEFRADNYHGSHAIEFTLDTRNSQGAVFHVGCYGEGSSHVPAIRCLENDGIELGWASYDGVWYTGSDTPSATGDFNGRHVYNTGVHKVMYVRKDAPGNSSVSLVAASITTENGSVYSTGWALVSDSFKRNLLGCNLNSGLGYVVVGPLHIADELSDAQAEAFMELGGIDSRPMPIISPTSRSSGSPITVSIAAPSGMPSGWTLRYTTDGADPKGIHIGDPSHIAVSVDNVSSICKRAPNLYVTSYDNNDGREKLYLVNTTNGNMTVAADKVTSSVGVVSVWHDNRIYFAGNSLYPMSWVDPAVSTTTFNNIGTTGPSEIAIESDGTNIYVFTMGEGLHRVDPNTGNKTLIYGTSEGSYEMSYIDGLMYINFNPLPLIIAVDCNTGSLVRSLNVNYTKMGTDGTYLYGIVRTDIEGDNLYRINPIDGSAIMILKNIQDRTYRLEYINGSIYLTGDYGDLNITRIDMTPLPPIGDVYSSPFEVGSPLVLGTSTQVKAAFIEDATSVAAGVVKETYTFQLSPPTFKFDGQPTQYVNAADSLPIAWMDTPDGINTEVVYTLDGSDPTTSPTAITWQNTDVTGFNLYPLVPGAAYPGGGQSNFIRAVQRHISSGQMSQVSDTEIAFYMLPFGLDLPSTAFDDILQTLSYPNANGRTFDYELTVDGSIHYSSVPPVLDINFDSVVHTVSMRVYTTDRSIFADSVPMSIKFKLKPPSLPLKTAVTSSFISVQPVNPNGPAASMYYTVDGSTPTSNSSPVIGPIQLQSGATLKVVAIRNGMTSDAAVLDALPEYEVTEVGTSIGSLGYHYHVAAQRVSLTSRLGESSYSAAIGTNITPTKVSTVIDGQTKLVSLWDSTVASGTYNTFNGLNWLNIPALIWSRYSYDACTCSFDWTYPSSLLPSGQDVMMFKFMIISKVCYITFEYHVNQETRQATITRYRTNHGEGRLASVLTNGSILIADSSNNITIDMSSGSISMSDGTGISTEDIQDIVGNGPWHIEVITNPESVQGYDDITPIVIPCIITTSAVSGTLRLAPATVTCAREGSLVQKTEHIGFNDPSSLHLLRHTMLTDGMFSSPVCPPAVIGYSKESNSIRVDGLFSVAMPGNIDVSQDFDSEIKISTDFLALMAYPEASVNATTLPTVSLFLADKDSLLNDSSDIVDGISIRMFVPADRPGAYPVYLELYTSGYAPAKLTLSSNSKQISLKMSGRQGGITMSAMVDGIETVLTTVAPMTGIKEIRIRRTGSTKQARKQITDLISYDVSATFSQIRCFNPVLVGSNFIFHGEATGFQATQIQDLENSSRAVWFNPPSGNISVEDISFEPSDGRLMVGIIEMKDQNILWTNTMYAKFIKVRTQADESLTGGTVIGIGSGLTIDNDTVKWIEGGYERSAMVGDMSWNMPLNHLDLRQNKNIVRLSEKQKIHITASKMSF